MSRHLGCLAAVVAPRLTPSVVADEVRLSAAVDAAIRSDAVDRSHLGRIAALVERFHEGAGSDTWQEFLCVDAAVSARIADFSVSLSRWAFAQALRYDGRMGRRQAGGGR